MRISERALNGLIHMFLNPLILMWLWEYFQQDFNLPIFGYWKCFWLITAVNCFNPRFVYTKDYNKELKE